MRVPKFMTIQPKAIYMRIGVGILGKCEKSKIMFYAGLVLLSLFLSACVKNPSYPKLSQGSSESSLMNNAELELMYLINNDPNTQPVYHDAPTPPGPLYPLLVSVRDVKQNYIISIMDKTSTSAVVRIRARTPRYADPFYGEEFDRNWVLVKNVWKVSGP